MRKVTGTLGACVDCGNTGGSWWAPRQKDPARTRSSNSQSCPDPLLQRGETVGAGEAGHGPFGQGGSPLQRVSTTGPRQGTEPKSQGTGTGRDTGARTFIRMGSLPDRGHTDWARWGSQMGTGVQARGFHCIRGRATAGDSPETLLSTQR